MAFKYTGILAKPIRDPVRPGPHAGDAEVEEWKEKYAAELVTRWRALCAAHGVEDGDMFALSWKLARTHVPAFKVARTPGPLRTWNYFTKAELRSAVDAYCAERQKRGQHVSVTQACGVLCKQEPWKSKLRDGRNPVQALRGHYYTADPVFAATMHRLIKGIDWTTVERLARNLPDGIPRSNKSR